MRRWLAAVTLVAGLIGVQAQSDLAATLEVLNAGVSVQRVNTTTLIGITQEAIVGVGDIIETDATGRARITFFADGTETDLEPDTRYQINTFNGDDTQFELSVEVLIGQTTQRLGRILNANSSYNVDTPGMTLAARGTTFAVRVENSGRSAMLVSEGTVIAEEGGDTATVPLGFGIRAENDEGLSDVVAATTFEELDAALDGCTIRVQTLDDVSLNVRLSPNTDSERIGTVGAADITRAFGTIEGGKWYRVAFRGGYGWVLSSTGAVETGCAGLRGFLTDQREDTSLYESLGDPISLDDLPVSEATPEATPNS